MPLFLITAVASFMVSYIKARAESLDIVCNGGVAERSERLIIGLVSYFNFHHAAKNDDCL